MFMTPASTCLERLQEEKIQGRAVRKRHRRHDGRAGSARARRLAPSPALPHEACDPEPQRKERVEHLDVVVVEADVPHPLLGAAVDLQSQ